MTLKTKTSWQLAAVASVAIGAVLPAHAETATYAIDPSHTSVTFEVVHFGTSTVRGRWDKKEGSVQIDRAAKTGKVELTIDMASVNTGVVPFNGHLTGDKWFKASEFPTAKFVGDKLTFSGDKVTEVAGTLTLMDKSNPVTLKASNFNCYQNPMVKREVCGGDFETTIQRSQWGVDYGVPNIPDNVHLLVQVEAVKQ